jgi:hypothetical protein
MRRTTRASTSRVPGQSDAAAAPGAAQSWRSRHKLFQRAPMTRNWRQNVGFATCFENARHSVTSGAMRASARDASRRSKI